MSLEAAATGAGVRLRRIDKGAVRAPKVTGELAYFPLRLSSNWN